MVDIQIIEPIFNKAQSNSIGDILKKIFIKIPWSILLTLVFAVTVALLTILIFILLVGIIIISAMFIVLYLLVAWIVQPFELIQAIFRKKS